jgi:hypothetical protein
VKRLLPWLVAVAFFMESLDTTMMPNRLGSRPTAARGKGTLWRALWARR